MPGRLIIHDIFNQENYLMLKSFILIFLICVKMDQMSLIEMLTLEV